MPALPRLPFSAAVLCAAGVTIGCTSADGGAMHRIFASWQGAPVEQVQAQWGPPQSVQSTPAGTANI
ncbi:hypothetical protein AB4120_16000 [Cupriavidus sp. 2KB_3]|uniref:hypothetical protein n=1 Tax=Cupriavidus TaxID=106589 RepID=UPI0021CC8FAA|nr:hypothetical protein [Cupriavidus campinensis]